MPPDDVISIALSRREWGLILFTLEESRTLSISERNALRKIGETIDKRLAETLSRDVKEPAPC